MNKLSKYIGVCCLLVANTLYAQNLDKLTEKDKVKVSGSVAANSVIYTANGIPQRRDPFSWFLAGNLNVNILDFSLPFSYSYSNQGSSYSQPFNIVSANPTYKFVKGFMGFTSMNFSAYTLAGHQFLGGGAELTPQKNTWRFAAMYGRLRKAVPFSTDSTQETEAVYERYGYGAKIGYEKGVHGLHLIAFQSKDNSESLHFVPFNALKPQENLVISVLGKTLLAQHFTLDAEYALSALTLNTLAEAETNSKHYFGRLYNHRASTNYYDAVKSAVGYQAKQVVLRLQYERVAPGYQTHGAYFFNNDMENITFVPAVNLLGGKLNLSANTGFQRNNLDNNKTSATKRWVGAFNMAYAPSKSWTFSGNYSNFSSFTKVKPQYDPFYNNAQDTLHFYQLAQSAGGTASYNFGSANRRHGIAYNAAYQVSSQDNTTAVINNPFTGLGEKPAIPAKVFNTTLGYQLGFVKSKTNVGFSANYNQSVFMESLTEYIGPSVQVNRSFNRSGVKAGAGCTYNLVYSNGINTNAIVNTRLTLAYVPKLKSPQYGKPSISLATQYTQRLRNTAAYKAFNELTSNVNLTWGF